MDTDKQLQKARAQLAENRARGIKPLSPLEMKNRQAYYVE
jgi:hypothetical protein